MRFRCDLLLRAFSNRCIFDENAQRIRPKRTKCMRFQTKKHLVWTRLFLTKIWSQKPQETPLLSPNSVIASENIQEQQNYLFPEGPVIKNCQEPLWLLELPNTVGESQLYLLPFDFFSLDSRSHISSS